MLFQKGMIPTYESKGFYKHATIQDFPIRGKAVYLVIKRRRWRDKATKSVELSDFLKGTGRDPRRYNK